MQIKNGALAPTPKACPNSANQTLGHSIAQLSGGDK